MNPWQGIWVPLVTPFENGRIDHKALHTLVERLVAAGVHGFVACGTTGEPAALTEAEQAEVLGTVLAASQGRPVLMGVSGVTPTDVIAQMARWSRHPVAGFLVPAPYYVRPSQAALVAHFTALADASALPLVLYDIPYRTGVELSLDTLRTLARHPRIVALKDCGGDARKTRALVADGELAVLAGEDAQAFGTLCLGGAGAIAAAAHLHADQFVAMFDALRAERLADARAIHHALAPMVEALFAEPNPAPAKAVMAKLGWMRDELRAPLLPCTPAVAAQAWQAFERAGDLSRR